MTESNRISLLLFFIVIFAGAIWTVILLNEDPNSLIFYGDAISRLVKTRLIWDNNYGIINSIGSVWLPLPYFLYLPLTFFDTIFFVGLVGTIVNLTFLAVSTIFIYKIIYILWENNKISSILSLIFALNPNLLYLSLTAMVEAQFLAFFLVGVYFLLKWLKNDNYQINKNINLSFFFIALSCLVRYEGWIVAIMLNLYTLILVITKKISNKDFLKTFISLSILNSAIIIWLLWNYHLNNDPFYFANAEYYSASWQAKNLEDTKHLYHNFYEVFFIYYVIINLIYGPFLLFSAIIGIVKKPLNLKISSYLIILIILFVLPLSTILNLYTGNAVMKILLNVRYALLLFPLLIILLSNTLNLIEFHKIINKVVKISIILLISLSYLIMYSTPNEKIITLMEARAGHFYNITTEAISIGEYLKDNYDFGSILLITGSSQDHRIMMISKISFKNFHFAQDENYLQDSILMKGPSNKFKWIVLSEEPLEYSKKLRDVFLDNLQIITEELNYKEVYRNKYFVVYKKDDFRVN